MKSQDILEKFVEFYLKRGHALVPNVSLVPEGDTTLLFVNSGMFPLVPYLSGQPHPLGKRLVNVQRSVRFDDLEEIGDLRHTMSFHMLGNWSLGDYYKKEQLPWAYEFLIEVLGIAPERLYATVYPGDSAAPRDDESIAIIKEIFLKYGIKAEVGERIFLCSGNWWKRGDAVGELGGPDSEVFCYLPDGTPPAGASPLTDEENFLEIGNSVFMQYKKSATGWDELPQKNVDFGGGLERIALVSQKKQDIFETDTFWPIILKLQKISSKEYSESPEVKKCMRILADHIRTTVFMAMDGVTPSNKDQGYVLRRILRRMVKFGRNIGIEKNVTPELVDSVVETMSWIYPILQEKSESIKAMFLQEEDKFNKTLKIAERDVKKILEHGLPQNAKEAAVTAFDLFQSRGYPVESFYDDLKNQKSEILQQDFLQAVKTIFTTHQAKSRTGAEKKFKGGLADQSEQVIKYHSATHLLQAALKKLISPEICQIGSNITGERLRFDFPYPTKLTEDQITQVEKLINETIAKNLPMQQVMLPKEEAIIKGVTYMKNESYPDVVSVYFIGETLETAISKEFCGGPHVKNIGEIGKVTIYKQESIGEGKQRVYIK